MQNHQTTVCDSRGCHGDVEADCDQCGAAFCGDHAGAHADYEREPVQRPLCDLCAGIRPRRMAHARAIHNEQMIGEAMAGGL